MNFATPATDWFVAQSSKSCWCLFSSGLGNSECHWKFQTSFSALELYRVSPIRSSFGGFTAARTISQNRSDDLRCDYEFASSVIFCTFQQVVRSWTLYSLSCFSLCLLQKLRLCNMAYMFRAMG